jgi:hypothetical protein
MSARSTKLKYNIYIFELKSNQYSETNVTHFLFTLLRIKGLYMFRALLAHPQKALHKRHLVYCVCVMSVGCTRIVSSDVVRERHHVTKHNTPIHNILSTAPILDISLHKRHLVYCVCVMSVDCTRIVSIDVVLLTYHVTRNNTPIHNILSTDPQLGISQKALETLPEDGNEMPKHVGANIHN